MRNFYGEGKQVAWTATAAHSAGDVVTIGGSNDGVDEDDGVMVAIVVDDAAIGEVAHGATQGVYGLAASAAAISANVGDNLWWDRSAEELVAAAGAGNIPAGRKWLLRGTSGLLAAESGQVFIKINPHDT